MIIKQSTRRMGIIVLVLIVAVLFSSGCITKKSAATVRTFPLTIALLGPAGDIGGQLPDNIITMSMPVESKKCSSMVFLPEVKIVRLDLQRDKPVEVKLSQEETWITWGQKFLNKKPAIDELRSERERFLRSKQIDAVMAETSGPESVTTESVRKFLSTSSNHRLFTIEGTRRALGNTLNGSNITAAKDLTDLLVDIGKSFCEKSGERSTTMEYAIIYKPGTDEISPSPSPTSTTNSTAVATPTPSPTISEDSADAVYGQLVAEVQRALNGQADKKEVDNKLVEAGKRFAQDYRFPYERARLIASIGKGGHPAFPILCQSAQLAITNGDQVKMLQKLEGDGGGIFHNLTEHDEWRTILQALQTKNSELARKCA